MTQKETFNLIDMLEAASKSHKNDKVDFYLLSNKKLNLKDENGKPEVDILIFSSAKGQEPVFPEGYEIIKKMD